MNVTLIFCLWFPHSSVPVDSKSPKDEKGELSNGKFTVC